MFLDVSYILMLLYIYIYTHWCCSQSIISAPRWGNSAEGSWSSKRWEQSPGDEKRALWVHRVHVGLAAQNPDVVVGLKLPSNGGRKENIHGICIYIYIIFVYLSNYLSIHLSIYIPRNSIMIFSDRDSHHRIGWRGILNGHTWFSPSNI